MRIGVLTSLYPSPERPFFGIFAARKWEGLVARGHGVFVVEPVPWAPRWLAGALSGERAVQARVPSIETRDGIRVQRPRYLHLPKRSRGNASRFAAAGLRALVSSGAERPDVVVCDYAWPAAAAVRPLRQLGLPVVVNGRGSDVLQVRGVAGLGELLGSGLAAASAVTAVSQDLLDAMVELGASASAAALTPNGVDAGHFRPAPRAAARERLDLAPKGEVVLAVGHLIERKDPLLALAAFERAGRPDARLVFVGSGPLEGAVRAAARDKGLSDRVQLVGERPPEELVDWYRAADLLLLTSSREGRPNVVLEALSTGCPVLATRAGGTAELLTDPRMLAAGRDPDDLAVRLVALLDDPPDPESLRRSVAHLTWDASLDALEGVLDAVAVGDANRPPAEGESGKSLPAADGGR